MLTQEKTEKPQKRNLAIDAYRALAMFAVAFGHWIAVHIFLDSEGNIVAGNVLSFNDSLAWMTWIFQVMPLFFIVGGFSSAMSLDSHNRTNLEPQIWVFHRLKRMIYPVVPLALFWLTAISISFLFKIEEIVIMGALASAIPLWFLANYMIDTAVAPYTLKWYRKNPKQFFVAIFTVFIFFDILNVAGIPYVNNINWVLGWMIFQIIGFAWKDNNLPSHSNMKKLVAGTLTIMTALVTFGPWPVTMVHFEGVEFSPTHPPSITLMLFGLGYGFLAILGAEKLNERISHSNKGTQIIMFANSVSMSVYLWHFTAATLTGLTFYMAGFLPETSVGSIEWWTLKIPFITVSFLFLSVLIKIFNRYELKGLFTKKTLNGLNEKNVFLLTLSFSGMMKLWVSSSYSLVVAGMVGVIVIWAIILWKSFCSNYSLQNISFVMNRFLQDEKV